MVDRVVVVAGLQRRTQPGSKAASTNQPLAPKGASGFFVRFMAVRLQLSACDYHQRVSVASFVLRAVLSVDAFRVSVYWRHAALPARAHSSDQHVRTRPGWRNR